ncbi:efflux RND transporter permease subunit, partial [candidate division KSB1 bacterium]
SLNKIRNSAGKSILPDIWDKLFIEDLMVFNFYHNLFESYALTYRKYYNKRSGIIGFLKLRMTLFSGLYYYFRFIVESAFQLTGKLLNVILITYIGIGAALVLCFSIVLIIALTPFIFLFNRTYTLISNIYPVIIKSALKNRIAVIFVSLILFAFSIYSILPKLGMELIPELHQGEFTVELAYSVGTPLETTAEYIKPIEKMISEAPNVERISSITGSEINSTSSSLEEGEHFARVNVKLTEGGDLVAKEESSMETIRNGLLNFTGITSKISRPVLFSFKTPIEIEVQGFNLERLRDLSFAVVERISQIEGLTDVKSNIRRGNPEVQIKYDRTKLAKNNLNIYQVASLVKNKVKGVVATEFKDEERKIDILVRVREEDKANLDDLYRLVVNPGSDKPIPLSAVASISINEGPSEIRRINQQRTALITANITGIDLGTITRKIETELRQIPKPEDFTFAVAGQNKEMQTSLNSLQFALLLAIFLIYVVMASQFESLLHPLVILFTIPLAIIGVIFVLYWLKISISIVVFIGMIMLAGIVVNNAIVLVDYINQLRKRGMSKIEAIVLAGTVRLRPILMTTATTVLGLLPMALGLGEGAEIRTPMAITVIAGLLSSTVLTLVVIPTVYSIIDRKQ